MHLIWSNKGGEPMKFHRFSEIYGKTIETIAGQTRYGFAMSDIEDFYDMLEWEKQGGYQGSVILFYDFASGNVYRPFQKMRNILYGKPFYKHGFFYFLQGDAQC